MTGRWTVLSLGLACLAAALLIYGTRAEGEEKKVATGYGAGRVTRMRAAGTVTDISDAALTMERKIKGKAESMEFVLERPEEKIIRGDNVRVTYIIRDDRNVATKVTRYVPRTNVKKQKKATGLTAAPPVR